MRSKIVFPACLALLSGCVREPDWFNPPPQRESLDGGRASGLRHFVTMSEPDADRHILRDVIPGEPGGMWRWTGQKPALKFHLPGISNLRLVVDFALAGNTMTHTGPVKVAFSVNGRVLERVKYDSAGQKHFEKPVDDSWLARDGDNIVNIELDKVYVAEADGVRLGMILMRGGFLD